MSVRYFLIMLVCCDNEGLLIANKPFQGKRWIKMVDADMKIKNVQFVNMGKM